MGAGNFCSVHVSLVPVLGVVGEQKTKPTQHSVAVLRSLGINPHLLACRSSEPLEQSVKVKLVSVVLEQPYAICCFLGAFGQCKKSVLSLITSLRAFCTAPVVCTLPALKACRTWS